MTISTNIHAVVRIEYQRIGHGNFVSHEVTFYTERGEKVEVCGFSNKPLELAHLPDHNVVTGGQS